MPGSKKSPSLSDKIRALNVSAIDIGLTGYSPRKGTIITGKEERTRKTKKTKKGGKKHTKRRRTAKKMFFGLF